MDAISVRIDATHVEKNQSKLVRFMGKCQSYDPSSNHAIVLSNGTISLITNPGETLNVNKNYEIVGKVGNNDLDVRVLSAIELSDNLNLDHYVKLVDFAHKVPELFQ